MTEATAEAPAGVIDETKHSTTVRAQNGATLCLTRGGPMNFLTVDAHRQGRPEFTVLLTDDDLRALLVSREQCCANCKHARVDRIAVTHCFERQHRARGQLYAPKIAEPKSHVCGKFEPLMRRAPREVAA